MTNIENIRNMNAAEMAKVICTKEEVCSEICAKICDYAETCPFDPITYEKCVKCIEKWLNSRAEGGKENPWEKLGVKSPELLAALEAFEEVRKKLRKPFTDKGRALAYKKLTQLSQDEETQIAIVNKSVERSWQGFFALETETACSDKKSHFMNYNQRRYTPDQLKRMGNNLLEDI